MRTSPMDARGVASVTLAAALRSAFAPLPPDEPRPTLVARAVAWVVRQQQRAALAALDDHQLADIGVTRAEAIRESRRWT
jgi:uncharacterized protein YjiS (DUF1127 family)